MWTDQWMDGGMNGELGRFTDVRIGREMIKEWMY